MNFILTNKRLLLLLVVLYFTLAPSVWFASLTLGTLKKVILGGVIVTSLGLIFKRPKGILGFLLISGLLAMSLQYTNSKGDFSPLIYGVIENCLFFLLGSNLLLKNRNNNRLIILMLLFPAFECLLTISNMLTGVPGWYAPSQMQNLSEYGMSGYVMLPLYATGFSWGRNGWGCALSLLLPLCFLLDKKRKIAITFGSILLLSILICGNRNGLLASLLSILLYYHYTSSRRESKKTFYLFLVFIVVFILIEIAQSFLVNTLRLNSGDISAGRFFQYAVIPDMISEMSFWGMGYYGTGNYLYRMTGELGELHNTYFRLLIDYGWLLGVTVFILAIVALIYSLRVLRSRNKDYIPFALIIISGLSLALFEPSAVFFTLGGYAIWWFALGKLVYFNSIKNG